MRKRFLIGLAISCIAIILAVFGLALRADTELEKLVSSQFNEQQLGLTRQIAKDIQTNFQLLEQGLRLLAERRPALDQAGLDHYLSFFEEWGVLGIGLATPDKGALEAGNMLFSPREDVPASELSDSISRDMARLSTGRDPNQAVLGAPLALASGPFAGRFTAPLLLPSRPERPDVLFFLLDLQAVAARYAAGVRSGKTGYAWVIDHQGDFLFHVESDFRGQSSYTIRQARNPDISYERINQLVRTRLLRGEEGTDWYISGWHWDVSGEMRKLLAFSPVVLPPGPDGERRFWSVGLAAPDTEVYGLMQPVVARQWLMVGLFLLAVFFAAAAFLFIALRWSETLKREVDAKTEHLRCSEADLRRERDKVRQSMDQLLQTQEKLMLSERFAAIGEAAAHLSHEIKNPLLLMGGFAQQVRRTLSEDDPRAEKLEIIAGEAKRLEHLLVEVRDFTRPPRPSLVETELNELVRQVADLFQEQAESQVVVSRLVLDPKLPVCILDPDQIKQVLINLTKNALEAMPEGGELSISTVRDADFVRIEIKDTGRGIPEEVMKKLFHPFFSTKAKGTGLGLAVSYKLVQDHGGEITAWSAPGQGARFTVRLPLNGPAQSQADQISPDRSPTTAPDPSTSTPPSGEPA
ncbi:sensor histidine kinase [Desulfonatronum thiodismutans]|uniref:sensor histidine kinase n=1 Tax=Desulfonatronum thiodismutans TaxID=159290 RepID=UPI0006910D33|nr:PAS domain-containing sensor histidine kinase [Desulfonatronum thiodismutans]